MVVSKKWLVRRGGAIRRFVKIVTRDLCVYSGPACLAQDDGSKENRWRLAGNAGG